jgi:hypothetical protein
MTPMNSVSRLLITALVDEIHFHLLPHLQIESVSPFDPVVVHDLPAPWRLLGTGNYAAVVYRPDFPNEVVKVYAPGRPGLADEVQVYRRLGHHRAFSECLYAGTTFLVLKRLHGITLYDCVRQGIPIPDSVMADIDQALAFARQRGLFPHDVHGRNVMMTPQGGVVVDVSDFLHQEPCRAWADVKRAYRWLYVPILRPLRLGIPAVLLNEVRRVYRWYRRWTRQL